MQDILLPSPLESIDIKNDQTIRFFIKRDDLIHENISGNKWRKLKYQIQCCIEQQMEGIITYGGAFSNHIVATAAACAMLGLKSVGIIRGESKAAENPTLSMAQSLGMNLHFVNRAAYKLKETSEVIQNIQAGHPNYLLVNEGGSHPQALLGVKEVISELTEQSAASIDYLLCAVGTGATFAGLTQEFEGELIGINVLKNKGVEQEICALLGIDTLFENHKLLHHYHRGGYAKVDDALIRATVDFYKTHGVKTDLVYTSKLVMATQDLLDQHYFKDNSTVVLYHSGGLQGNAGMNYRYPGLIHFDE